MGKDHVELLIGMDIGSTTVKAVVVDPRTDAVLWRDYRRHNARQPETVLEFLRGIERTLQSPPARHRVFVTGSGGRAIAPRLGAKFVQEVNAVSLAVERFHPEAGSVIELGGQDAKIIIFAEDPESGRKRKISSMNDKCAGGTGATIDKITAKLRIPLQELCAQGYCGIKLHPVAGKCGVFAETDINSLQKMGIPREELMASLFEAIVGQNLSVLTRGNTLRPEVLLLGGPNTYIRGMVEAWKHNIPKVWKERKYPLPEGIAPQDLIKVPQNAQYFAALGAVEFGRQEEDAVGRYEGTAKLEHYIAHGRFAERSRRSGAGLVKDAAELAAFKEKYRQPEFVAPAFRPGQVVQGFIGLDGGSTSTKAVLLDPARRLLLKTYQLSKGNPLEDTVEVIGRLRRQVESQGAALEVMGVATTGYAKDILRAVLDADVAIVETVAHTESALHFYREVDVICDVGGQDIKIIMLQNRQVKDFRVNTQCSAGNGYFLQTTAMDLGIPMEEYADAAFTAQSMPIFGYGCAVFMQSDIVDFQRRGWTAEEIMAGLAAVLPKNIWLYVAQVPNLAVLGTNFVLQGGTQKNLAAVKAQVDFIESRFHGKGVRPRITVHEHCGESGAVGAALESIRLWENGRRTTFIGLDAVARIAYTTHRSENTRCSYCKNKCLRTFVDVQIHAAPTAAASPRQSEVPLAPGAKRLIVGNSCERGLVENLEEMKSIKRGMEAAQHAYPNLQEIAASTVWKSAKPPVVADPLPKVTLTGAQRQRLERMKRRAVLRIGIPRVLNLYSLAPLFSGYFESLGIQAANLVYSDFTSDELYKSGIKRGSIDPCFPSKLAIPHVHNLLTVHHRRRPLDIVFFPMIDCLPSPLVGCQASRACPTVTTTPAAVKAAFTKECDLFAELGIRFLDPFANPGEAPLFARQMFAQFAEVLGLSWPENLRAVAEGYRALDRHCRALRATGGAILEQLEAQGRIGIVLLGRPYHNDPGICHDLLVEFQGLGYPLLTQDSLPVDGPIVERLFGDEVRAGIISHPLDIADVWKNSYSENTNRKIWAAKFAARHPALVALELSSFKCGHDAPIYSVVEEIIQRSGTPYFCFKEIDENKSTNSIKIRIETIAYFLQRYREIAAGRRAGRERLEARLRQYELRLRQQSLPAEGEAAAEGFAPAGHRSGPAYVDEGVPGSVSSR
jgi:activator of 2-hydroxyglutaryl-CoA dehydratase/predicted nucleotide-binding protein (sugar kinase/HSP70/actin superfamily)